MDRVKFRDMDSFGTGIWRSSWNCAFRVAVKLLNGYFIELEEAQKLVLTPQYSMSKLFRTVGYYPMQFMQRKSLVLIRVVKTGHLLWPANRQQKEQLTMGKQAIYC